MTKAYGMWREQPNNVIVEWNGGLYNAWKTGERMHRLYLVIYQPANQYEYVHKHRMNPPEFQHVMDAAEKYNHTQFMDEFEVMDHTLSLERVTKEGEKYEKEKHHGLQQMIKYTQYLRHRTVLKPHKPNKKVKGDPSTTTTNKFTIAEVIISLRWLFLLMRFDSTLGYPGEGPPKGSQKPPSQLGFIEEVRQDNCAFTLYRARATLMVSGTKKTWSGPKHKTRQMAKSDLRLAQTAANHEEMARTFRSLAEKAQAQRAAVAEMVAEEVPLSEKAAAEEAANVQEIRRQASVQQESPAEVPQGDVEERGGLAAASARGRPKAATDGPSRRRVEGSAQASAAKLRAEYHHSAAFGGPGSSALGGRQSVEATASASDRPCRRQAEPHPSDSAHRSAYAESLR